MDYAEDLAKLMGKQEVKLSQLASSIAGTIAKAEHNDRAMSEAITQIKREAIRQARCEISEDASISDLMKYPQAAFSEVGQGLVIALKIIGDSIDDDKKMCDMREGIRNIKNKPDIL